MKNKILLIIALVCMVVPFMVLGSTASAEVVSVEPVLHDFVLPQQVSGWIGLWQINLNAVLIPATSSNVYDVVSVIFTSSDDDFFFCSEAAGSFWVSSVSVDFSINDVVVSFVNSTGNVDNSVDSSDDFFCYLYVPTYSLDSAFEGALDVYIRYYYNGIEVHPDVSLSGIPQSAFLRFDDPFLAGYNFGLDVGLDFDRDTVYQHGYDAGVQYAYNTVNKNSASYQQGLTDGRAEGGEYTFLGLIGAVLDAPINALFGHTTSDGVFHPGLFSIEILGMNMSAFILSIFTLGLIIAILRLCLGGK